MNVKTVKMKAIFALLVGFCATGACFSEGFSLGARLGVAIPEYTVASEIKKAYGVGDSSVKIDGDAGFLFAIQGAYAFTPAMSVQVEFVFATDEADIKVDGTKYGTFSAPSLQIPVLFKYTWKKVVDISGIAGFYFAVPTGDGKITISGSSTKGDWTPSGGFIIGAAVGKDIGPGQFFGDLRFALDFEDSSAEFSGSDTDILKKTATQISVGYAIPLGGKR